MKNRLISISALLLACCLPGSALAEDLYGFLKIETGGNYTISDEITADASFPLLDEWAQGTSKAAGRRPGYVKFRLNTLAPAANKKLENSLCRDDGHWQPAWAPCSAYRNLEDHFVKVGGRDHATSNYFKLSFLYSDYWDAMNDAFGQRGFDSPTRAGKEAWQKRVVEVHAALAANRMAEAKTRDDVLKQVSSTESEMAKFQPIISYEPFKVKQRPGVFPPLFGDLAEWANSQEQGRQAWANDVLAQFKSFYEQQRAEAERSYPAKLAQQKAEDAAREKAERAAEADRQRQAKLEETERQRRLAAEAKQVNAFRATLKVESETNCGPVIAIRGNLIQVTTPVQGYGNEHWIRRNELFPRGYGCWFLNGKYVGTQRP